MSTSAGPPQYPWQNPAGSAPSPPTILVPLDGTRHALAALPVARGLASIAGAVLHIVHVGRRVLPPQEKVREMGLSLEQVQGSVISQATGPPVKAILRLAMELHSAAIVICTHTAASKPSGQLGSVAEGILKDAPCPVVLVNPERGLQPWELHRILLPQNGSPSSTAALEPAMQLARQAGAEIIVLHVAGSGISRPEEPGTLAGLYYADQPQHAWPGWAGEFLQRLQSLGHLTGDGPKLRLSLAQGPPGEAIRQAAVEENVDLIVLHWRGSLEPERATIMKAVLAQAPCPVLIAREGMRNP